MNAVKIYFIALSLLLISGHTNAQGNANVETDIHCSVSAFGDDLCTRESSLNNFVPLGCNDPSHHAALARALTRTFSTPRGTWAAIITDFEGASSLTGLKLLNAKTVDNTLTWQFSSQRNTPAQGYTSLVILDLKQSGKAIGSTFYPKPLGGDCGAPSNTLSISESQDLSYFILQRIKEVIPNLCQAILAAKQ